MKAWRHILKDRIAGAGLLAILVQLLLFQAMVTSFTCSTMSTASAAQGPAIVICHGGGTQAPADASTLVHRSAVDGTCFDCPCGVCCATGSAVFALNAPGGDLGPAYTLALDAEGWSRRSEKAVPATPPLELRPDPTGPPALSA